MGRVQGKVMQEERTAGTKAMRWEPTSVLIQLRAYRGSGTTGGQNPAQAGRVGLGKEFDL